MRSEVSVTWGENATYRFDLEEVQPLTSEAARRSRSTSSLWRWSASPSARRARC